MTFYLKLSNFFLAKVLKINAKVQIILRYKKMFRKNRLIYVLILLIICIVSLKAQQNPTPATDSEDKDKAQIEYQRQLAEVEARNKQITENNLKIQTVLNEGIAAFNAKNYNLAIEKFDEGLNLDPVYWGTAPVLLTNKAAVLRTIGVNRHKEAAQNNLNAMSESSRYFTDAVKTLHLALQIFTDTPVSEAYLNKDSFEKYKFNTLKELAECYRLLVITDKTRINEAIKAYENYIEAETDNIKKDRAINDLKKLRAGI